MRQVESFFLGILAFFGALVSESILMGILGLFALPWSATSSNYFPPPDISATRPPMFLVILLCLAFIEEFFKFLILTKKINRLSRGRTILINSLLVGCGFAAMELFFIYNNINLGRASATGWINYLFILILHASTAGIMGYGLVTATKTTPATFLALILLATAIHFFFNYLLLLDSYYIRPVIFSTIILLIIINIANFMRINRRLAI